LDKSDKLRRNVGGWYREVPPPPALADRVLHLWEMWIPDFGDPAPVRILPNASVDIVVYVSEPSVGDGPASVLAPGYRSYVVGSTLRSFVVRSAGWRHVVGASLLPGGVQPILGVPARVIGQGIATLDDIVGNAASRFEERVVVSDSTHAMARLAPAISELGDALASPSPLIHAAVGLVRQSGGAARVDELANEMSVSTRKLERHFLEHLGLTPKLFSRLVRFDRAARAIASRGQMPWSQFALAHGYSDQAHFINEFKEFAGVTPAELETEQTA
jgi:AraC-like DNA-binding protein